MRKQKTETSTQTPNPKPQTYTVTKQWLERQVEHLNAQIAEAENPYSLYGANTPVQLLRQKACYYIHLLCQMDTNNQQTIEIQHYE